MSEIRSNVHVEYKNESKTKTKKAKDLNRKALSMK